jgi:superoxide dismutase, Fe-Mn family
MPCKK